MFTGLIETIGTVAGVRRHGKSVELCVVPDAGGFDVEIGGSVAIDGVCLTLEKRGSGGRMFFTAVAETLNRTTFDNITTGRRVNLERAMRADGRLDGHIVLGHVDAVGKIIADEHVGVSVVRTVRVTRELAPFMAEKGSVAIDGISLTIAKAGDDTISVSLIPATIGKTTMSVKKVGDIVNIECDVFARYIYRMITAGVLPGGDKTLLDKMQKSGF
ncbi:MAG: riboflavin synthase [Chitinispirillales bacterium]|jgi:riboflavin synthase|nr:riboflavin synthase [Chitinispirillales bacterium]